MGKPSGFRGGGALPIFGLTPAHSSYARARGRNMLEPLLFDELVLAEVGEIKRLIRASRRLKNKQQWRRAISLRSTRYAICLRAIEEVLGDRYAGRTKEEDGRWAIRAKDANGADVVVAYVGGGPTRRLEEVRAPLLVDIVHAELIDVTRLVQRSSVGEQQQGGAK